MDQDLRYQIVLFEATARGRDRDLRAELEARVRDLGLDPNADLRFIDAADAGSVRPGSPRVAVYFGGLGYKDTAAAQFSNLITNMVPCVPVVDSLRNFQNEIPHEVFKDINGFDFTLGMEALVAVVLEALQLLRSRRRVFISYKRKDSEKAALQLYRALDERSFDVFLDTLSVRQGEVFQEMLWHRMADSDLVILLYTKNVLTRADAAKAGWVEQELDRADASGITVLQVIWPDVERSHRTHLFLPFSLADADLAGPKAANPPEGGYPLESAKLKELVTEVERVRAHALRSREKFLADKLCGIAQQKGRRAEVGRKVTVGTLGKNRSLSRVLVWPRGNGSTPTSVYLGLGVPDSTACEDVCDPGSKVYLVYDDRSIAPWWKEHLKWLLARLSKDVEAKSAWQADTWIDQI